MPAFEFLQPGYKRSLEERLYDQTTRLMRSFGMWRPSSKDYREHMRSEWFREAREPTQSRPYRPYQAEAPIMAPGALETERKKRLSQARFAGMEDRFDNSDTEWNRIFKDQIL